MVLPIEDLKKMPYPGLVERAAFFEEEFLSLKEETRRRKANDCPICLKELLANPACFSCGHVMHLECARRAEICPKCRDDTAILIERLFF